MNTVNVRAYCIRPILAAGFALALAFTFSACSGDDSPSEPPKEQNGNDNNSSSSSLIQSSSSSVQSSNTGVSSSSSGVCGSNDLGKGYDVIGKPYINWTDVNSIAVLDQDKMCQDGILELDKQGSKQDYASFSGNSIYEFYSKRNENMKISGSLGADIDIAFVFSANLDVKFATKTSSGSSQNSSYKYYYAQIRSYLYTGEDQIKSNSASAQNLSKYLSGDFVSDLKSTKSAGQILDLYGSHIFIHYYKGGSLEANYTYLGSESSSHFTSASQMELAAKGSFAKIDAGIGMNNSSSIEQDISELQQNMSFNYETYGGNPLKATSMTQLGSEYGAWVTSIRSNARTTGIKDFAQSFIPIWDLAQQVEGVPSSRIAALRDEFKRRAEAQGKKFPMEENCTPADNNSTHYCSNGFLKEYGSVAYEGQTYNTVEIGTQTWMAENLNYNAAGSRCYDNDPNCDRYGRLYNWASAMNLPISCNSGTSCLSQISAKHKGICPSDYHIPTNADWDKLFLYAGGKETAGRYLKAAFGWQNCGSSNSSAYKCEDKYGFSAQPGGYGKSDGLSFLNTGYYGVWWSASEDGLNYADSHEMSNDVESVKLVSNSIKAFLFSVRCVKD